MQEKLVNRGLNILIFFLLILSYIWQYTTPENCGDIFWHIQYGKYHIDNLTLIPDHTIFSWTFSDNATIYCSWLADIIFYFLYVTGGWPMLFGFRYLCTLVLPLTLLLFAKKTNKKISIYTLAIILIAQLTAVSGNIIKPEIISLVLFSLLSLAYYYSKASEDNSYKSFIFFPFIFLFWANCHGVFIFGLGMLFALNLGEFLNKRLNKSTALSNIQLKWLYGSSLLSFLATFITPYGYKIYSSHLSFLRSSDSSAVTENVMAYWSLFTDIQVNNFSHLIEFAGVMLAIFILFMLFFQKKYREIDWAILIANFLLAFLYYRYLRAAFYWPAFWAMTIFYLYVRTSDLIVIDKKIILFSLKWGTIVLFVYISGRSIYQAQYSPQLMTWMGLGFDYQHPVQESEFIKKNLPRLKLFNSYNTGSYAISSLYPEYKVFIDPRAFPYKTWRKRYMDFHYGKTPLDQFQKEYDFDIAIIDYWADLKQFQNSSEWLPVFYGTSGTVYIKKNSGLTFNVRAPENNRFANVKNIKQCLKIFNKAIELDDFEAAVYIYGQLKKNFNRRYKHYDSVLAHCESIIEGIKAYKEKRYDRAMELFTKIGLHSFDYVDAALLNMLNQKTDKLIKTNELRAAYKLQKILLESFPENRQILLNTGLIGAAIELKDQKEKPNNSSTHNTEWKNLLIIYMKNEPTSRHKHIINELLNRNSINSIEIPIYYKDKTDKTIIIINPLKINYENQNTI